MGRINSDFTYSLMGLQGYAPESKALAALDLLDSLNIRHIRASFSPWYWWDLQRVFFGDFPRQDSYLNNLMRILNELSKRNLKIHAVLMWRAENLLPYDISGTFDIKDDVFRTDLLNEGLDRFDQYCKEVVGRFHDHPAISGWEVTNELDLMNPAITGMSRPEWRGWLGEKFFPEAFAAISLNLGSEKDLILTTGNANYDVQSEQEFLSCESGSHASVHYYRENDGSVRYPTLHDFKLWSDRYGKELFLGEWGKPFNLFRKGWDYNNPDVVRAVQRLLEGFTINNIEHAYAWELEVNDWRQWKLAKWNQTNKVVTAGTMEWTPTESIKLIAEYRPELETPTPPKKPVEQNETKRVIITGSGLELKYLRNITHGREIEIQVSGNGIQVTTATRS